MTTLKATFGAGCFWGVEAAFREVPGVVETAVGYAGGTFENPSYEDVCSKQTGHAEVVEVEYDPSRVSFERLLDVFWRTHNPAAVHRHQGAKASQYRSAIFYHSPEQESVAEASLQRLHESGRVHGPIQTEITPASTFHRAEDRHQRYHEKHGGGSCHT